MYQNQKGLQDEPPDCCCVGCLLDKLERIRGDPVWGTALASIGIGGWCSDPNVEAMFHVHFVKVAAENMLEEARLQQLRSAFLKTCDPPVAKQVPEVSSLDMPCHAVLDAALCCAVPAVQLFGLRRMVVL